MRLADLMKGVECDMRGYQEEEIGDIETNSKKCKRGDVFLAIRGSKHNGVEYIGEALLGGASIVVGEEKLDIAHYIRVKDVRKAYALMSANYYSNPARELKIIAVVGTNGKSTTAHFIYEILKFNGFKVGLIGTSIVKYDDIVLGNDMTTPDPIDLHRYFRLMRDNGIEYVVMEVSAHAIYLNKMHGVKCEIGLFTNFSEDHLDYFKEMDIYKRVKMSYFNSRYLKVGIVNSDDHVGRAILEKSDMPTFTYGLDNPSDVFAIDIEYCIDGTRFVVNMLDEIAHFATEIVGKYNVYNILGASLVARLLGVPMYGIRDAIESLKPLDGRYNIVKTKRADFIIDYAHTPVAMKSVILETRRLRSGKIYVIFGCGGDRDKTKRPIMGNIASTLADEVILTSDNSRSENTGEIIKDIKSGISNDNVIAIEDRRDAIRYAYEMSSPKDVVLVLGKGAETYQDNGEGKIYYSDREAILELEREI